MVKKIAHWYLKIVETISVCLLFLILICMCIQIVCRLLTIGQSFTEELARLAFNVVVYLSAPLVLAEGADISVDMVVNLLPAVLQKVISIFVNVLIAVFGVLCVRSLITLTASNVGVTAVSMTWIKMNWLYYTFMFSFGCLSVVSVMKAIACIMDKPQTIDINAEEKEKQRLEEEGLDLGI
ncbi:MAG: TRAP transporter small permease subunit [Clostridiales bacterium]|nr:TRAP transporter small permease subunit [Clostridiales bacterium]